MTMRITPKIDVKNLVRELAENKVNSLELIREALSNAKDHGAHRIWIRTMKSQRNEVSVLLIDDGAGMNEEGLEAFWGVGASAAKLGQSIGYKGHGTKLYFGCHRLTVVTRTAADAAWRLLSLESPSKLAGAPIDVRDLSQADVIHQELHRVGLLAGIGTAILIEQIHFGDARGLLSRRNIESFCDWFTAIGDVRSGLFEKRVDFHDAVKQGGAAIEALRPHESELRPLTVFMQINGEKDYFPIGQGPMAQDKELLGKWTDDLAAHKGDPGLLAFGHRFADQHESTAGAQRVRDDLTAMRLTTPQNWVTDDGIAIVARVEGHRRQRETYLEASWQNHNGLYSFENRFGLWLCRDFIPVTQRNDLLKQALEKASSRRLQFDFNSMRNWQVFINFQSFLPTANRNGISNQGDFEAGVVEALGDLLERSMKQQSFQEWGARLRKAKHDRRREQEVEYMENRRLQIETWLNTKNKKDGIDPVTVIGLRELDSQESLLMRAPSSVQELFYLYGLLSARFEMPIQILEYDTGEGVDAIGRVRVPELISPKAVHGRIEFKFEVSANNPIDHFFDAIDAVICWKVDRIGDIYEQSSSGDTIGKLRKRAKALLDPPMDTHEISYRAKGVERIIPVLQIASLFSSPRASKSRS